jgi:hypothetical protein
LILNVNNNFYTFGKFFSLTPPVLRFSPRGSKKKNIFLYKIFSPESGRKFEDAQPGQRDFAPNRWEWRNAGLRRLRPRLLA